MKLDKRTLRSHPLLSLLPASAIRALSAGSSTREYPKGSVLLREGAPCEAVFLVVNGRCEARRTAPSGRSQVDHIYGPGDTFGETELLNGEPCRSTVTTLSRSMLLRLDAELLRDVFVRQPCVAGRVSQQLRLRNEQRLNSASHPRRIVALVALTRRLHQRAVAKRLATSLHNLAHQRVLLVHLLAGDGIPTLADWADSDRDLGDGLSFVRHVHEHRQGYHELNLHTSHVESDVSAVAPMLGHFGRHFDHVIVDVGADVSIPLELEVLAQADMAFVWIEPTIEHLYDFKLLLNEIRLHAAGALADIKPVVCVGDCGVVSDCERTLGEAGCPVHSFVRGAPIDGGSGFIDRPGNFGLHINSVAREIARCRIGLALSSGASKGLAHIGVIQVLEENGIEIDCVAGSSMGAYVGAVWACGHDGESCEKIARELETRWGVLHLAHPSLPPRRGFLHTGRVIKRLRHSIGTADFSDLVRPFRVVATVLDTLERAVFSRGDVARAVEASIAIPGICVPVTIDGETYIDGGVADPLPVDVLREMGIERIIAVNTIPTPECLRKQVEAEREVAAANGHRFSLSRLINRHLNYFANGNVADVMLRALHGAQTRVAERSCRDADVVLRPWINDARWYDFTNPRKYIALGRSVAEQHLPEIKALLTQPSNEPRILSSTRLAAAA